MYKSEVKKKITSILESMTAYSEKILTFDVENATDLEKLSEAGELAKRLSVGNFVNDLNGRTAIEAAKDELKSGKKLSAVYIIKRETGRGLKEAFEFVNNGFKSVD